MKKTLALALLLVCDAAGVALAAPTRAAVERLLAGYEPGATAADLKRLGEGTDRVLVAIASDPKTSRIRRNRAISAIAAVPSPAGQEFLRAVLRDQGNATEGADLLDLQACIRALPAFGSTGALEALPLLAHANADVRVIVADALAAAKAHEAVPPLRLRLGVEREPEVLRALQRALAALQQK